MDNRNHLWCPVRSSPSFGRVFAVGIGGRAVVEEGIEVVVVGAAEEEGDRGTENLDSVVEAPFDKETEAVGMVVELVAAYCKRNKD